MSPGDRQLGGREEELARALLLERVFALEPERFLRRMPDRETMIRREPGGARVVTKRQRGGPGLEGLLAWLRGRRPRSPGRREHENLEDLAALGLRVPRALRFAEDEAARSPLRRGGRSVCEMECVEHFEDARLALGTRDDAGRRRLLASISELVRGLHARGWIHRDLYLQHFLVPADEPDAVCLIDVGRARFRARPARRWWRKDLAALLLHAPRRVSRAERLRFLLSWLDDRGARERPYWKRWAREVSAKAERMRAHRPRHEDPDQRVGVEPERAIPRPARRDPGVAPEASLTRGEERA